MSKTLPYEVAGKSQLSALTGLRFIAAFAVLLLHSGGYFGIPKKFPVFFWGTQPVSFFFVLSGFILIYSYPKIEGSRQWIRFYAARFARIWPLHFLTFMLAVSFSFIPKSDFLPKEWGVLALATSLLNVTLLQAWFPFSAIYSSFNEVSWSISAEMGFYLVFPFMLINWQKYRFFWVLGSFSVVILAIFLSFALNLPRFTEDPLMVTASGIFHVNPMVRFFEFSIGVLTGSFFLQRKSDGASGSKMEFLAIALLVGSSLLCNWLKNALGGWGGEGLRAWIIHSGSCFAACFLVYVFAHGKGVFSKIFSTNLMRILGESSFSLYLLHQLYFVAFRSQSHPLVELPLVVQGPFYVILMMALSYLCWRWFEIPVRAELLKKFNAAFPK